MFTRNARLLDRVERLEAQLKPPGRVSVMFRVEAPGIPSRAAQLAAFKAEKSIGPHDTVHAVVFTFH